MADNADVFISIMDASARGTPFVVHVGLNFDHSVWIVKRYQANRIYRPKRHDENVSRGYIFRYGRKG